MREQIKMRKHMFNVFTHLKAIDVGARKPTSVINVPSTADAHKVMSPGPQ